MLRAVGLVAGLGAVFGFASEYLRAQNPEPGGRQDPLISLRERVECLASGDARTSRQARTGAIRFIGTDAGRPIPHPRPLDAAASPEAAARSYLSTCGSLFGLMDQASELSVTRTAPALAGRTVVRFQQTQSGIPVIGAELVVHLDAARNIIAVAGETLPVAALNPIASVDADVARETALQQVATTYALDPSALATTSPALWFYVPGLIGPGTGPPALVWRVEVTPRTLQPLRELVLVDATRGGVALHFNQVETIRNRATYSAGNLETLPGTLVCDESNPSCAGADADAVAAHVYAGDTYDFYLSNHGRDSLDNAGMPLVSTVHYGATDFQNAFWNGSQMAYGDGFALADDVVGHELTHGVTQFTSGLFYYYQSGAINESLSDVFGELIDLTNGRGNDAAGVRWIEGEDLFGGSGGIRNMQNPPALGDPDKITSSLYYLGAGDNGGVHTNSGINNKAASLMVDGGTFNGQVIAGLGIPKVAKVYYEVQTHLLTSGSDYGDLYDALYQGCVNLVGTAGITTADCQQVRNTTIAVEMNLQPVAGFNPDAPVCSIGQQPVTTFFDNLESGTGNFSISASVGSPRWYRTSGFAHSGLYSLVGDDLPVGVGDSSAALATSVVVPPNAFLHFAHAFSFDEPNFDGGVVEYSTNGGSTWTDAGALFDVNGYTGALAAATDNPLAGRPAFIADSHGYRSSRLNLASLAGQSARFRWRLGLNSTGIRIGWLVDDVRIYVCSGAQLTAVTPNSGYQGESFVPVAITGDSTHFVPGQTSASFGTGITVHSTTVTDATHATVIVTIDPGATLGPRDVVMTTGTELAAKLSGFSVSLSPVLTQVVPSVGQRGTTVTVAITGQLTHFAPGQTIANFGFGIAVNSVTVTDATHATVNLTIPPDMPIAPQTVLVTTGSEAVHITNGFTVTASPFDIRSVAYVVGRRLSPSQGGTDGTQTVSVVDTSTNLIVATVSAGVGCSCVGPDGVAVTPDGALVYVTNEIDNTVSVIRTATNSVIRTIRVGVGPAAVAVSPDGARAYVVNGTGSTSVSVIDTATSAVVATVPLGVIQARGVAVAPDGSRLYVSTYGSHSLKVIDTAANAVVATIGVGNLPLGVDVSPNGALVHTANYLGNSVSAISSATNTVAATIPVGTSPYKTRIVPDGTRIYVANSASNVSVINTLTNSVSTTVPASSGGVAIDVTPDGTRAYLGSSGQVRVINTASNLVTATIPFSTATTGYPLSIVMGPAPARVVALSGNLAFRPTRRGSTSTALLTISNTGNSPLTVSSIVFPQGFSGNWAGGLLAPGTSRLVVVSFAPTLPATYGGVVTVNTNRTSGTFTIPVSGLLASDLTRDNDFDGDGKTDISVFRPASGSWHILTSTTGFVGGAGYSWGVSTDVPVPGDYDGDARTDLAVYRPSSGHWFIRLSSTNYATWSTYQWGAAGDFPVRADYDGDGITDIAVYRPATGHWFIRHSTTSYATWVTYQWGTTGDVPVPGDYDGDGRADLGVYRPSTGHWVILQSSHSTGAMHQWGAGGDVPVAGDYDADGRMDLAVYRPATGHWFIRLATTGYTAGPTYQWGGFGDKPVPGDYDGDRATDIAVYRTSTAHWFILKSSTGYSTWATHQWGATGDVPIPKQVP